MVNQKRTFRGYHFPGYYLDEPSILERCNKRVLRTIVMIAIVLVVGMISMLYDPTSITTSPKETEKTVEVVSDTKTEDIEMCFTNQGLPIAGVSVDLSNMMNIGELESASTVEADTEVVEESVPVSYNCDMCGWATADVRIRKEPNTDSEILGMVYFNDTINCAIVDEKWVAIECEDGVDGYAYVCRDYLSDCPISDYNEMSAVGDRRKSFMHYTCITARGSRQYELESTRAYTESNGVRAINGRYLVALGSYYTHDIGRYVDLVLENGNVIPCIIGDAKADCDTINNHSLGVDGSTAEFIVSTSSLNQATRVSGDVSDATEGWDSPIVSIKIYNKSLY